MTQALHIHVFRDAFLLGLRDQEPEALLSQLQTLELVHQLISGCSCLCLLTGALVLLPDGLGAHLGAEVDFDNPSTSW